VSKVSEQNRPKKKNTRQDLFRGAPLKNPVFSESLAREFWKNQIHIANSDEKKKGGSNG